MSNIPKIFAQCIERDFDDFLFGLGFSKTKNQADDRSFTVICKNAQLYVKIGASLDPRDGCLWLTFGEGSTEFPESDWNGTALWRLVDKLSAVDSAKEKDLYEISEDLSRGEIEDKARRLLLSCKAHGMSFLTGDLSVFHRVRSAQNQSREPYKISSSDTTGHFPTRNDEESQRLKEKFSK